MKLKSIATEEAACRKAWKGKCVGTWAWHLHHETLTEQLTEPASSRIDYILSSKPEDEQALRLRLFRPAAAWAEYDKVAAPALAEYDKVRAAARAEYEKVRAAAWAEYDKVEAAARAEYEKVRAAAHKVTAAARAEYEKVEAAAWAEYDKARAAALAEYNKVEAAAHRKACPGCPWNGKTIFA
jgi:hypothetical protein